MNIESQQVTASSNTFFCYGLLQADFYSHVKNVCQHFCPTDESVILLLHKMKVDHFTNKYSFIASYFPHCQFVD